MTLLAWSFALFAGIGVGLYLGAVVRPFVHRDDGPTWEEIYHGTPDTPKRRETIRRAEETYGRWKAMQEKQDNDRLSQHAESQGDDAA